MTEGTRSGSQAFWTAAVALPAVVSLLRVWVESGGQLQIALLLIENIGTANLFAAMFITGTRLVTAALVAIFAIGRVLADGADAGAPLRRRPLFARWTDAAPSWFLGATLALAAVTWQILYLPLLLPAFVLIFQHFPGYRELHRAERTVAFVLVLAAYAAVMTPTIVDAHKDGFVLALLVGPPLLAPVVAGPVPGVLARLGTWVAQPAVLVLLAWGVLPVVNSPLLPLTVTTISQPDGSTELLRGHVVAVDDTMTTILQDRSGVRYVDNDDVQARVLCPSQQELPIYNLRVHDLHVEDSLLEALGRRVRPTTITDAACRSLPH